MKVDIKKLKGNAIIPTYATDGSGAFDFYNAEQWNIFVRPDCCDEFGTGVAIKVPENHVMLMFSRSGHGFKKNIRLGNCVGVIDSDYTGEIRILLQSDNQSEGMMVFPNDRIAQGIIVPIEKVVFNEVEELPVTERGSNGFGSTG